MSLSIYECDTCKRTIERTQNKRGLDVVGRCIITDGCKGSLRLLEVKKTFNNPSVPLPKTGLTDWVQRRTLYNHVQPVPEKTWIVKHNLNCFPSFQVFIYDGDTLVETNDFTVKNVSAFESSVTFTVAQAGELQCIARSAKPTVVETVVTFDKTVQVSTSGIITIATRLTNPTIRLGFTSPRKIDFTYADFTLQQGGNSAGPWSPNAGEKVLIENRRYTLHYIDVSSFIATLEKGSYGVLGSPNNDSVEPFASKDTFLLLTNAPYETVDRNLNQYIITERMSLEAAGSSLTTDGKEVSADVGLLKNTFPSITIVTQ